MLVALGVKAAWLTNLNLFGIWSIPVRNSDIGVTLTGIILAGAAYFWRESLGMFGGLYRKYTGEAKPMEHSEILRRVAWPGRRPDQELPGRHGQSAPGFTELVEMHNTGDHRPGRADARAPGEGQQPRPVSRTASWTAKSGNSFFMKRCSPGPLRSG